ncbi:hypothetical protein [Nocardia sp. CA-135398]|uniref:hypothetical protein n=1 Tax=Nocardia sp. CA-135398 TaxID=3239977 RepID=UPI003D985958
MATSQPVHDRLRHTISRLVQRGLGVEDYWRAVSDALDGAVPSEGYCLMTMDPATMLPTAEFVENGMPAEAISRLVEIELREPDSEGRGVGVPIRRRPPRDSDGTARPTRPDRPRNAQRGYRRLGAAGSRALCAGHRLISAGRAVSEARRS